MIKHIPNLFTLLNLLCGCIATVLLFENEINIYLATLIIFTGIVFDFLDGFFARKLNIQSKLGLELDSLADLITSGLVPGIIIFRLFKIPNDLTFSIISNEWFAYFAFIITISSAYRLAKFNIQENSKNFFIGLPVPANTILILSLLLIFHSSNHQIVIDIITNDFLLIAVVLVSSFLMNSNYKFISLKFDDYNFNRLNNSRYFIIVISFILFFTMSYISIPVIFLIYFLTSFLAFRN
ncbi:CDP-alcohol phosphatidyltransferase family protein [Flavobacteriaceae bacterium]|jgi:CDP-diacylglycerol---serine O-phosphatidyltransferase|nr:CDP-alcohol phosphatidyltransferase family protein [Flavobacteriales bacterium]MBL6877600.1 CDP-alcohol phosphatidyltransferase family protein [Flavobacteriaceae bacterium]MDA9849117.1 CDP-alcohol phosphatidyltransferase family protein [Flavobacteriaceae bacterium]